jgi:hypothetical protein
MGCSCLEWTERLNVSVADSCAASAGPSAKDPRILFGVANIRCPFTLITVALPSPKEFILVYNRGKAGVSMNISP